MCSVRLSAYADDVAFIIRSAQDVTNLNEFLEVYQKASSSRIIWQKSASFVMGDWENGGPPALPQNCSLSVYGFEVLVCNVGR